MTADPDFMMWHAELPFPTAEREFMGIMANTTTWTADRVRALDWDRGLTYELLDAERIVSPAPTLPHLQVVRELAS